MEERKISAARLAKKAGLKERSLLQWIPREVGGTTAHRPANEVNVLVSLSAALRVPKWWFEDPSTSGEPPPLIPEFDEVLEVLPPPMRRIVLAARDPALREWLHAQIDLYEKARQQGRLREQA